MSERTIRADDGTRLWVREVGDRTLPAVICCHGGPGLADDLGPIEEVVEAAGRRSVRWDQRGSGRSDDVGPYSVERFVGDLGCVIDAAGDERPVLLGHSWGANLALLHAQRRERPLAGLIYACGTGLEWWPEYSTRHKEGQVRRLGPTAGARLAELQASARTPEEDEELRLLYIRSELHDPTDGASARLVHTHEQRYPPNRAVNLALNTECRTLGLADQIDACRDLAAPVLVIHGASDPRPAAALDSLLEALPSARLVVLERAGHRPWLDAPDSFAEAVHGFLAELDAG